MLDAPYVIKNIIGPGEVCMIYGSPKCGKTFFALDLAARVANGLPWFDHAVHAGLVVYLSCEMGARLERRVWAWQRDHKDEIQPNPPMAIIPQTVNLLDELMVEKLFATLAIMDEERGNPTLLVVDTLARAMCGGDENSAQDMGRIVEVTERLRDTFGCATLLIHHSGKDTAKGARGSSALLGAVDACIAIEGDDTGIHRARVEWSRAGEAGQDYAFKLPVRELGIDRDGDVVTTCVLEPIGYVPKAAKATRVNVSGDSLRESVASHAIKLNGSSSIPPGVKACTIDQWKAQWLLRTGYEPGRSADTNFAKDKARLLAEGKISISKPYVWINP